MSDPVTGGWDYVAGGYAAAAVLLGGYALLIRRRARVLGRHLPPELLRRPAPTPPAEATEAGPA